MCRSSLALYTWCHCQEAQLIEPCHSGRVSPSGSCDSVASETIRLHCYCRYHAEKGFLSAHKENKKQKKAEKKDKRRSMGSTTSVETFRSDSSSASGASNNSSRKFSPGHRLRKSWHSLRRLSFDH